MPRRSSASVRVFYPRLDRTQLIEVLREGVDRLKTSLPLRRVVLFGSYAAGRHTVASDIDLLVIYSGEPRPDAYALTKRILGIPRLEPHLYTEAECEGASSTVDRMTEHGVELFPGC